MSLWQDQTSLRGRGDGDQAQPGSRRAAREAERRAAESFPEHQVHPSGVVNFDGDSMAQQYGSDQDFRVHDTDAIWSGLDRQGPSRPGAVQPSDRRGSRGMLDSARPGIPASTGSGAALPSRGAPTGVPTPGGLPPVTDDLMSRVRGAVRDGRGTPPQAPPAPQSRSAAAETSARISRRDLRLQQPAEEQPYERPRAWSQAPVEAAPQPWQQQDAEPEWDEPTAVRPAIPFPDFEPTAAIAYDPVALEPQRPETGSVDLPTFFAEPAGDDHLAFSDPVELEEPEPLAAHPHAVAQPTFIEPSTETTDVPTDLAGFEALIRRARTDVQSAALESPTRQLAQSPQPPALPPHPADAHPSWGVHPAQTTGSVHPAQTTGFPHPPQSLHPDLPAQTTGSRSTGQSWRDDHDEHAGFAGTISRDITATNGSQNAMILPRDPAIDLSRPANLDGGAFITGTHRLDSNYGRTGATKRHDGREVDYYDEPQEARVDGVEPKRASRAVSGATPARPVMGGRKMRSSALPTVLAIVAGVMAIGVITLLVGSWVLRLF